MKKLIIVSILASLAWAQDSTFYEKGKIAAQEDITKIEVSIKEKVLCLAWYLTFMELVLGMHYINLERLMSHSFIHLN